MGAVAPPLRIEQALGPKARFAVWSEVYERKVAALDGLAVERKDIHVHRGDCNRVLLEKVLPRARYENNHRALCILDPYGLLLTGE
jgi:hypothetical protein